ncbi:MAG TPA: alpha/beta fold hydrolase [Pseudonocardia sp.]
MSRRTTLLLGAGAVGAGLGAVAVSRARSRAEDTSMPEWAEHIEPDTEGHRGGSGTPLLLLHGISVTWRSWRPVLPKLEAHHDVIAPTLLGHSGAPPLGEEVTPSLDALVDGVEAELDRLGLDTVHVAGNSLGGWVAIELARRGRARSLTLFSPAGAFQSNLRIVSLTTGIRVGVELMDALGPRMERLALTPRGRKLLASAQFAHPERVDPAELIADIRAIRHSPVVRPLLSVIAREPMTPLTRPGCPVRVVWPHQDKMLPFAHYGEPVLERLPTAELVRLDDVGHVPMSDDPEAVSRLILEVTRSVDGSSVNGSSVDGGSVGGSSVGADGGQAGGTR